MHKKSMKFDIEIRSGTEFLLSFVCVFVGLFVCVFLFSFVLCLKCGGKSLKILPKWTSKWYQILETIISGGVLEHFGDPLGAKS